MLNAEQIKAFIENDQASKKKQAARTGLKYYEGEHDIKDHRIFFVDADIKYQVVTFNCHYINFLIKLFSQINHHFC